MCPKNLRRYLSTLLYHGTYFVIVDQPKLQKPVKKVWETSNVNATKIGFSDPLKYTLKDKGG